MTTKLDIPTNSHTVTIERSAFDPSKPAPPTLVRHVVEMTGDFRSEELQEKFGTNLLYALNGGISRVVRGQGVTTIHVDYGSLPDPTRQLLWGVISERVMESLRIYAESLNQWDLVRVVHGSDYKNFRVSPALKGVK